MFRYVGTTHKVRVKIVQGEVVANRCRPARASTLTHSGRVCPYLAVSPWTTYIFSSSFTTPSPSRTLVLSSPSTSSHS